jgi:bifunctional DNA-binding transcriptional regulator/antitoxin component of YhaV-PrlF toxin-antitoxin module
MERSEPIFVTVDKHGRIYPPREFRIRNRLMDGTKYIFERRADDILMIPIRPGLAERLKYMVWHTIYAWLKQAELVPRR